MSRMCGRNQESRAGSVVCWPAHAHSLRERNEVSLRPFLPRRSASGLGTRRAEPPRHRCRSSRCGRLAPPAVSQAARPRALVSNSNAVVLVIRSGGVISVGCWPHGSCLAAHDHFSACPSVGGLVFPSLVDAVRNTIEHAASACPGMHTLTVGAAHHAALHGEAATARRSPCAHAERRNQQSCW